MIDFYLFEIPVYRMGEILVVLAFLFALASIYAINEVKR